MRGGSFFVPFFGEKCSDFVFEMSFFGLFRLHFTGNRMIRMLNRMRKNGVGMEEGIDYESDSVLW